MNCPGHAHLFSMQRWSYRDLPYRYAEPGQLHRREPWGTLHGLLRVRHFIQDDAHIFCTEEQIVDEVSACLAFAFDWYGMFGFHVMPSSRRGRTTASAATSSGTGRGHAARALEGQGLDYRVAEGEGAFYAPKIDLHMTDSLGRSWQLGTVQLDYNMPERFGLALHGRRQRRAHAGDDPPGAVGLLRALHRHPHRALRRRVPGLAGAGPGRGAPARRPPRRLRARGRGGARAAGLRAEVDDRTESVGRKIREAELRKVPYMLVVGDREAEQRAVAVRRHREGDQGTVALDEAVEQLSAAAQR